MCCISIANQSELGGLFKTQWSKQDWEGKKQLSVWAVTHQMPLCWHEHATDMSAQLLHNCHSVSSQRPTKTLCSMPLWRLVKLGSVINKPPCFETMTMKVVLCFCRKLPWLEPVFVHQVIEVKDMPGLCVTFLDLHSSDWDVFTRFHLCLFK